MDDGFNGLWYISIKLISVKITMHMICKYSYNNLNCSSVAPCTNMD